MTVDTLNITNFKNISSATLEMSPKINCFLGNNGMGKSNMLDALYLLSYCRSFTGLNDAKLIKRGEDFAIISAHYTRRGVPEDLYAGLKPGRRKSFRRGSKEYRRLADHIGLFPLVMVAPSDMSLVGGEPSERRRFIDRIAAQSDPRYMDMYMRYVEAIEQRNRLLKEECTDSTLYEAVELQLDATGAYITRRRAATMTQLVPLFNDCYSSLSPGEMPSLTYRPALGSEAPEPGMIAARMAANRRRDIAIGYTASGPHRDDIELMLDDAPLRHVASQGQTKTYTIALRFAQYRLLRHNLGISPLLLLDDIFDKLDATRVERIVSAVSRTDDFGQIFITDTNRRHLDEIVSQIAATGAPSHLWSADGGVFTPLKP